MKVDMIKRNNTEYPLVALNTIVTCQNNPSTQIKTGTINGFTLNNQSESFKIYLPNGNTANNIKLNISNSNGETGAKDIKIYKEGSLVDVSSNMDVGTILEVFYDGTQYIVIGNPIVKQTSDYTIYADGRTVYDANYVDNVLTGYQQVDSITSSTSGDVIDYEVLKQKLYNKMPSLPSGTSIVNYSSQGQQGIFLVTKTTNELYSALYLTGYNRQITVFFQDGYIIR